MTKMFCPEFANPDSNTGCIALEMAKKVEALDYSINGTPAGPGVEHKPGIAEILTGFISEYRYERSRKWTRMQKLTLAAIVVPILSGLLGWGSVNAYTFLKDVSQAVQELHQLHKTVTREKKDLPPTIGELFSTSTQYTQQVTTIDRTTW